MNIFFYLKLYVLTASVFFIIDIAWLGYIAKGFYQRNLGFILGPIYWPAVIMFYLIFTAGILTFAVIPALKSGSPGRAVLWGGLFGFFTYTTYDLTNLATIEDWPLKFAIVDVGWGVMICAAVALLSFFIAKWLS